METKLKFKVGDKVRVKSFEWYNANKDEKGVVRIDTDDCVNFVAEMSKLCGEVMQIEETKSHFYIMEGSIFSWQDWMLEYEAVQERKKRIISKGVAQEVVRCTKYCLKNEEENSNLQKKLFEIGCKWASGDKEVANEYCKYLYVDNNLYIRMGDVGEEDFYKEEPSAELSVNDILNIEIEDITMETKEMTKEEVLVYLNDTKILCTSKEESKKVQEKLFELGLKWKTAEKRIVFFTFLFIIVDKKIQFTDSMEWWVKSDQKQIEPNEILAIQLKEEKPKFDPETLKPFHKVLVRDSEEEDWRCNLFSHCDNIGYSYKCVSDAWLYCIPYNEETKHLVGTTQDAPEFYRI